MYTLNVVSDTVYMTVGVHFKVRQGRVSPYHCIILYCILVVAGLGFRIVGTYSISRLSFIFK